MINILTTNSIWGKLTAMASVVLASISLNIVTATTPAYAAATNVEYLIVGGGGGGGARYMGGGGGAGGFLEGTTSINTGSYSVTVGAGGLGGQAERTQGNNGGDSVFNNIRAYGGGGGGSWDSVPGGKQGGSGGGNSGYSTGGGATPIVAGQGNQGGSGQIHGAGGGGGAGSVGGVGNSARGGNGGAGKASSISGTSTFYAAGGGGGSYTDTSRGMGGNGIGGNGGNGPNTASGGNPTAGLDGTGSGGGGANGYNGTTAGIQGGKGGSGIVILRYASPVPLATGGEITQSGGFVIHTFTSSGTLTFSEATSDATTGTIALWSTPITPTTPLPKGWILADGAVYNNSQYPELSAAFGAIYGGTAGITFAVPNLVGRVPVGLNSSDAQFDQLGINDSNAIAPNSNEAWGTKSVRLTTAQMPSHTHITNAHGHSASAGHSHYQFSHGHSTNGHGHGSSHSYTIARVGGGGASEIEYGLCCWLMPGVGRWFGAHWQEWGGGASGTNGATTSSDVQWISSNNETATNQFNGGVGTNDLGDYHSNLQPYTTMYYIVKT